MSNEEDEERTSVDMSTAFASAKAAQAKKAAAAKSLEDSFRRACLDLAGILLLPSPSTFVAEALDLDSLLQSHPSSPQIRFAIMSV